MSRRILLPALAALAWIALVAPGGGEGAETPVSLVVGQLPAAPGSATEPGMEGPLRGESGDGGRIVLVPPAGAPRVLTGDFHLSLIHI